MKFCLVALSAWLLIKFKIKLQVICVKSKVRCITYIPFESVDIPVFVLTVGNKSWLGREL